jgi:hypothetical protein
MIDAYEILVAKPGGKRPLRRLYLSIEDNIKIDFKQVGYEEVNLIREAQDRVRWRAFVSTVMNCRLL